MERARKRGRERQREREREGERARERGRERDMNEITTKERRGNNDEIRRRKQGTAREEQPRSGDNRAYPMSASHVHLLADEIQTLPTNARDRLLGNTLVTASVCGHVRRSPSVLAAFPECFISSDSY
jgi:hypothetical protein